jgi:hypothetical protein
LLAVIRETLAYRHIPRSHCTERLMMRTGYGRVRPVQQLSRQQLESGLTDIRQSHLSRDRDDALGSTVRTQ